MSATRDKTQKITFVYSNLYSVYRQGVERAREGATAEIGAPSQSALPGSAPESAKDTALHSLASSLSSHGLATGFVASSLRAKRPGSTGLTGSGAVIKAGDKVQEARQYTPAELLGKRLQAQQPVQVARPTLLQAAPASIAQVPPAPVNPLQSLKQNLKELNDLQARLRFMLKELEELIK